jgi:hypothetical protein
MSFLAVLRRSNNKAWMGRRGQFLAAGTVLGLDGERRGFGRKEVAGAGVEVLLERRGGKRTNAVGALRPAQLKASPREIWAEHG